MKLVALFNQRGKVCVTISIPSKQWILVSITPLYILEQVPHLSIIYSDWNQYLTNRPRINRIIYS